MRTLLLFSLLSLFSAALFAQTDAKTNTIKHGSDFPVFGLKNNLVYEDFESGIFPPTGWTVIADTTPQTWDTASFDPHSGSFYAHCLYDQTLSGVQNEYLVTPVVDMRGVTSAVLSFYFQFSQYWGITPNNNYDLYVFASTDGGTTFPDTVWHELDTDTSAWNSFEWVLAQVDMANYIGDSAVALAFVYYGYDGAEAAIDDIMIQTAGAIAENETQIMMYPNPAKEYVMISADFIIEKIELYDMQNKLIFSSEPMVKEYQLSLKSLPTASYQLRIVSEKEVKTLLLIKE